MAANLIQVSPEVLRGKAADIRAYRGEHDEVMNKLRTLVNGLEEIFKGAAQQAFVQKFESMQPTFTQFSELLENYAKDLEATANNFENFDGELASHIQASGQ